MEVRSCFLLKICLILKIFLGHFLTAIEINVSFSTKWKLEVAFCIEYLKLFYRFTESRIQSTTLIDSFDIKKGKRENAIERRRFVQENLTKF